MAPADPKDWLLAATALTTVAASSASANETPQAGVVTGAVSSTRGNSAQAANAQSVVLGDIVRPGEQFQTGPEGVIHILFLDQSSVTLGPDSKMTLDTFSHDASVRSGKIIMTLQEGSLRVVGGINSKTEATEIRTTAATVSILGGISVVESQGQRTSASFLFGTSMTVSGGGETQTVTRPGFSCSLSPGQAPSAPTPVSSSQLSSVLGRFEATSSTPAASAPVPSAPPSQPDATVTALISTSDKPDGQASAQSTLAVDRLVNPNSAMVGSSIAQSLSDNTLPSEVAAPVTNIRTPPLPAAVS